MEDRVPRSRRSREEWAGLIASWRSSGQTAEQFARAHRLHPGTFAWWRSQLGRRAESTQEVSGSGPVSFVRVTPRGPERSSGVVEVVLACGVALRVPPTADAPRIAELVAAIRARLP